MSRGMDRRWVGLSLAAILNWAALLGCQGDAPRSPPRTQEDGSSGGEVRPARVDNDLTRGDTIPGHPSWTEQDWAVLEGTLRWAFDNGIDTLPIGERVVRIGERYLGTPYVPQTLDPPGDERLVINLRGMDCVTYVEGMLTIAHLVRGSGPSLVSDAARAMERYEAILTTLRYRGGRASGYASRLHYFSEWIQDNASRGVLADVTAEIGGVPDPDPIDFMTTHRAAYRQLEDEGAFRAVQSVEERLRGITRYHIPQERLEELQRLIMTGDVIAATSTLEGLDVAHTGLAVWRGDALHLMHAPLVGEAVELSAEPLVPRLLGISSQDGIVVARPLEGPLRMGSPDRLEQKF